MKKIIVLILIIFLIFMLMKFYDELKIKKTFKDEQIVLLSRAILKQKLNLIRQFSQKGININYIGESNITPLVFAYIYNKMDSFEELLKLGADPNIFLDRSKTNSLIFKIIKEDKIDYLTILIKYNANINLIHRNGHRPLFFALDENKLIIAKLLLNNGAKANLADDYNNTVFTNLIALNQYKNANFLLSLGVNVFTESNNEVKKDFNYYINKSEKTMTKSTPSYQEFKKCKEKLIEQGFVFTE